MRLVPVYPSCTGYVGPPLSPLLFFQVSVVHLSTEKRGPCLFIRFQLCSTILKFPIQARDIWVQVTGISYQWQVSVVVYQKVFEYIFTSDTWNLLTTRLSDCVSVNNVFSLDRPSHNTDTAGKSRGTAGHTPALHPPEEKKRNKKNKKIKN